MTIARIFGNLFIELSGEGTSEIEKTGIFGISLQPEHHSRCQFITNRILERADLNSRLVYCQSIATIDLKYMY